MDLNKYLIDDDWKNVIKLNKRLNKFHYGIPLDSIIENPHDKKYGEPGQFFFDNYRSLSPELFEKYKGGVCWDYVPYEARFFKEHFKYSFKTYFIQFDNKLDRPTHTFLIFYKNNKCYYFESSFKPIAGIYEADSDKEIINFVMKMMNDHPSNSLQINLLKYPVYVIEYNADDRKMYGLNVVEYMNYLCDNYNFIRWKYKNPQYIKKVE